MIKCQSWGGEWLELSAIRVKLTGHGERPSSHCIVLVHACQVVGATADVYSVHRVCYRLKSDRGILERDERRVSKGDDVGDEDYKQQRMQVAKIIRSGFLSPTSYISVFFHRSLAFPRCPARSRANWGGLDRAKGVGRCQFKRQRSEFAGGPPRVVGDGMTSSYARVTSSGVPFVGPWVPRFVFLSYGAPLFTR